MLGSVATVADIHFLRSHGARGTIEDVLRHVRQEFVPVVIQVARSACLPGMRRV